MEIVNILNKSRIILKSAIILVMILLLSLPMFKIDQLIMDREARNKEVRKEFAQKWGGKQNITSPTLKIPYHFANDFSTQYFYLTPEVLEINGEVFPQVKKRGIFEVPVYSSNIDIKGYFEPARIKEFADRKEVIIDYDNIVLYQRMTDFTKLNKGIQLKWNDQTHKLKLKEEWYVGHAVNIDEASLRNEFSYSINFNGVEDISFSPEANEVNVTMKGEWDNPSCFGTRMTNNYTNEEGTFVAEWKYLNQLERDWDSSPLLNQGDNEFGVNFMMANDHYAKSHRSTKYAFLLIGLTFVAFFFLELITKKNIHPL
ncbi:cell envelope integrity protein CreD [Cyclobacteriaceae bacterium]|nr:cell envelope integrity protein CreD [Cyclobacteriaceae bacterium]